MFDEIAILFISGMLAAVGYFVARWMTGMDSAISDVKQRVEELGSLVNKLEHDQVPLREYLDNISSLKNNQVTIQSKLLDISKRLDSIDAELNHYKFRTNIGNTNKPYH